MGNVKVFEKRVQIGILGTERGELTGGGINMPTE
jgi:hypothetical protein